MVTIPFTYPRERKAKLEVKDGEVHNYWLSISPASISHAVLESLPSQNYQMVESIKGKIKVPANYRRHIRSDWSLKDYKKYVNRKTLLKSSIETLWAIGFIDCVDKKPFKYIRCKLNKTGVKAKKMLEGL